MADDRVIQIAVSPSKSFPRSLFALPERRGVPGFSVEGRLEMERGVAAAGEGFHPTSSGR